MTGPLWVSRVAVRVNIMTVSGMILTRYLQSVQPHGHISGGSTATIFEAQVAEPDKS